MPHKTTIEWVARYDSEGNFIQHGYSSNPIRAMLIDNPKKKGWVCTKASPACDECYAEAINLRFGTGLRFTAENEKLVDAFLDEKELAALRNFKEAGARVFIEDMADLFHRKVTNEMLDRLFEVFEQTPHYVKMLLTKHPERMRSYLSKRWKGKMPLNHIWLGSTVESQDQIWRVKTLLETPAYLRFLSCEPLLNDLKLIGTAMGIDRPAHCVCGHGHGFTRCPNYGGVAKSCHKCECKDFKSVNGIRLIIGGGESGAKARPTHPQWAESLLKQAEEIGAYFFWKQWGSWTPSDTHQSPIIKKGDIHLRSDGKITGEVVHVDYRSGEHWRGREGEGTVTRVQFTRNCDRDDRLGIEITMQKLQKKRAGRQIDGRVYNELPPFEYTPDLQS